MKRAWLILRAVAATSVLTMPVWAKAPGAQYASFDSSATQIVDNFTALHWQRTPKKVSFTDASDPKTCQIGTFAGRLPTLKELLTIFDEESHEEYLGMGYERRYVDVDAFGKPATSKTNDRTPSGAFWTSSPAGQNAVWTLDFTDGSVRDVSTSSGDNWLRCVEAH